MIVPHAAATGAPGGRFETNIKRDGYEAVAHMEDGTYAYTGIVFGHVQVTSAA